jgi:hypothetical protein
MRRTSARVTVRMNRPGLVSPRIKLQDRGEVGTSTNITIVTPTHLQCSGSSTTRCPYQLHGSACYAHDLICQPSTVFQAAWEAHQQDHKSRQHRES